jgi:fucose 4-O-acetylase-like acetyltransferase
MSTYSRAAKLKSTTLIRTSRATDANRLSWLDAARGIGIILVVYAHAGRALFDVLPHVDAFRQADHLIYAFHMSLFFFLAGLVSRGALSRSRATFLSAKLLTIVYPYFLWSLIYWGLELVFSHRVNSPLEPSSILRILWQPIEHLWFLYVLFLCQVLAAVAWPRVIILVALAAWFLLGPLPPITVPALWTQLPWFTIGLLLAPRAMRPGRNAISQAGLALLLAAACTGVYILLAELAPRARATEFFSAGIGIALSIALATACRANRVMTYLGAASLSIYLMHTIFSAGAREILEVIFPVDGLTLLAVTIVAGLAGPLVVHELARRTGAARYLGLGKIVPASPSDQLAQQRSAV